MSRRKERPRKGARQKPHREPKPRILIVCEGTVTEPQYFRAFARSCRNGRVEIQIDDAHGVARTLVQAAINRKKQAEKSARNAKDENLKYDEIWVVFDDEHPDVAGALESARQSKIDAAVSNPNFELWLLLHFRGDPGMQTKARLVELLKQYLPNYRKHVEFDKCASGYRQAVQRAQQLDTEAVQCGMPRKNPSTSVYKLTESIRGTGTVEIEIR